MSATQPGPGYSAEAFFGPAPPAGDSSRDRYWRRVIGARQMLLEKGMNAASVVYLASADDQDDNDLNLSTGPQKPPQVVEAVGLVAANRIAQKTHRLASQEEIERFKREQAAREADCRAIEQTTREREGRGGSPRELAQAIRDAITGGEPAQPARTGRGHGTGKE